MKKYILSILVGLVLTFGGQYSQAATHFYGAIALTGGTTGSLDGIDGADLATGDAAYTITATAYYIHYLNAASGAGESSPDIISPDDNAGNKRWILIFMGDPVTAEIAQLTPTDGNIIVGNDTTWVAESDNTARTSLGVGTGDSPQFTGIELGHATDTTLTRTDAGDVSIEGKAIYRADGTDVPIADGGTGQSTAADAFTALKQAATDAATGVVELATNAEALTGTDTERAVTPDDLSYVLDRRNISQVNLLKNTLKWVMSNSDGLTDVSAQITLTDITSGVATTDGAHGLDTLYDIGILWEFDSGDFDTEVYEITAIADATHFTLNDVTLTDSGTPGTGHTVIPGCTAADALGPDEWTKGRVSGSTDLPDLWRQHNDGGTLTHDGAFYSLKFTGGTTDPTYLRQPLAAIQTQPVWTQQFAGRTVSKSIWVKASVASKIKVGIVDSAGSTYSDLNAGTGWERLKVTHTVTANPTSFYWELYCTEEAGTAVTVYYSQPMGTFGSVATGYVQPPGEWVILETKVRPTGYYGVSIAADTTVNIESTTSGMLPKGLVAFDCWASMTGNAANDRMTLTTGSGGKIGVYLRTQVGSVIIDATSIVYCDVTGDFYIDYTVGTITDFYLQIHAVQVVP